ncbi:Kynurenine formamidase, bacterial [Brevibacillus laterosporus]|nr:Kynurenine formamidase, bacterial [Brevibacillus laterosporus]
MIEELPLDAFVGEAVLVDARHIRERELPKELLKEAQIKEGDIVLIFTGLSKQWNSEEYIHQAPYLSKELADELVRLKIKAIGLDFISPDEVETTTSPIHHILLGNEIYLIENLTNLDHIGQERFFFQPLL